MVSISPDEASRPSSKSSRLSWFIFHFFKSKSAATSLEYALIIAGITVAIIVSVSLMGGSSDNAFKKVGNGIDSITEPAQQSSGDKDSSSGGGSNSGSGGGSGDNAGGDSNSGSGGGSGDNAAGDSNSGSGGGSGGNAAGGFNSGSGGGSGGNAAGGFNSGSGGGSGGNAAGGFNSGSGGGSGGDSGGGSSSGSTDGRSSVDSMSATAGAINGYRGYGNSGGGQKADTSSGYVSDTSPIGKGESSIDSVYGGNETGNTNNELTKKRASYKLLVFILILVLGTLLFWMSRKYNKSAGNNRDVKTIDLTSKN